MTESAAQPSLSPFVGATASGSSAERFARGMAVLAQIGGAGFDLPLRKLAEVAPDLARFTVEFAYGDVLARPGLALPLRQLVTVASLLAHGRAQRQLHYHMNGLLNAGATPETLVELLYVAIVIVGFPIAVNAVALVREIFHERGIVFVPSASALGDGSERYAHGLAAMAALLRTPAINIAALSALAPDFAQWSIEFEFGEILARDVLPAPSRQLAIITMLATVGNRDQQLQRHLAGGLSSGLSVEEITEALMQLAVYAGFPSALNALTLALTVFASDPLPAQSQASLLQPASVVPSATHAERMARGLATLALTSAAAGAAVVASFEDLAPAIGRAIVEHAYGDIFARPTIDLRTRELAACSAFAAVGNKAMETPLRVHVNAALHTGASQQEIVEVLLNLIPHCGYPTVEQALRIAGEEFARLTP